MSVARLGSLCHERAASEGLELGERREVSNERTGRFGAF